MICASAEVRQLAWGAPSSRPIGNSNLLLYKRAIRSRHPEIPITGKNWPATIFSDRNVNRPAFGTVIFRGPTWVVREILQQINRLHARGKTLTRSALGPTLALAEDEALTLSEVAHEDLENACSEGGPARDIGRAAPPISCLWSTRS